MIFFRQQRHRILLHPMAAIVSAVAAFTLLFDLVSMLPPRSDRAVAQTEPNRALTLRSDIQEANSKTGVITARGNVQMTYPARQIQATAAQAQYFSRERRIILSGNVYVLQEGNSLRGETVTYLIDEGRFVALPDPPKQVEAIYLVPDKSPTPSPTASAAPFSTQPQFPAPATPQPTPTR